MKKLNLLLTLSMALLCTIQPVRADWVNNAGLAIFTATATIAAIGAGIFGHYSYQEHQAAKPIKKDLDTLDKIAAELGKFDNPNYYKTEWPSIDGQKSVDEICRLKFQKQQKEKVEPLLEQLPLTWQSGNMRYFIEDAIKNPEITSRGINNFTNIQRPDSNGLHHPETNKHHVSQIRAYKFAEAFTHLHKDLTAERKIMLRERNKGIALTLNMAPFSIAHLVIAANFYKR